jgi:hypothetical protein
MSIFFWFFVIFVRAREKNSSEFRHRDQKAHNVTEQEEKRVLLVCFLEGRVMPRDDHGG